MTNIASLAKPDFKSEKITNNQTAEQICKQLQRAEYNSRAFAKQLVPFFKKSNDFETCKFVWAWLVKYIVYNAEPPDNQTAKTIARFVVDGYGDCKHYATTAVGILNECGIKTWFLLAGQEEGKKKPNHIYAASLVNGKQVIIDPCRKNKFNDECKYFYKWSCQPIKREEMLTYLSGDAGPQTVINELLYNTEVPAITSGTKEPLTPYLSGDGLTLMKSIAPNTNQLPAGNIYLDVPNGSAKSGQYFLVVGGKRVNYMLIPAPFQGFGKQQWVQATGQSGLFMTPAAAKAIADAWIAKNGTKGLWDKIRDAVNKTEEAVKTGVQNVVNTIKKDIAIISNKTARTVFLAAVSQNAGGLAVDILQTWKVDPEGVKSTFAKLGGDFSDLKAAVLKGSGVALTGDDSDMTAFIEAFKMALPYIIEFFKLFKKNKTVSPAKQLSYEQSIKDGLAGLSSDPKVPKSDATMPAGEDVALLIDAPPGSGDPNVASFFSPLGLYFKTPLLLALLNVQNPLISLLFAFVSTYCFVGLVVFPFYEWNWLNLREFVKPFVELPKKLFYGSIKKIC